VLEKMINEKNALLSFAGLEADKDFLVSILVSQIYDLLTCVTPQKLQTVLDELNIEIKANKFRNAIRYYKCLSVQPNISFFTKIFSEICYIINAVKKRVFGKIVIITNL